MKLLGIILFLSMSNVSFADNWTKSEFIGTGMVDYKDGNDLRASGECKLTILTNEVERTKNIRVLIGNSNYTAFNSTYENPTGDGFYSSEIQDFGDNPHYVAIGHAQFGQTEISATTKTYLRSIILDSYTHTIVIKLNNGNPVSLKGTVDRGFFRCQF